MYHDDDTLSAWAARRQDCDARGCRRAPCQDDYASSMMRADANRDAIRRAAAAAALP